MTGMQKMVGEFESIFNNVGEDRDSLAVASKRIKALTAETRRIRGLIRKAGRSPDSAGRRRILVELRGFFGNEPPMKIIGRFFGR